MQLEPISRAAVERQVDAVVSSDLFRNSTQLCRFLKHVVERTLAGDSGALKENSLGIDVFERGSRYDPRTDPVVRVEARRLRAKLERYYDTDGAGATVIIRIPKGSYVPTFEHGAPTAAPAETRSVAVLPFASVGADPETEYFADGLTDEVISLLGTIPGLNVVARSSVYQFKGRTGDAREVGRSLNAGYLVEGSVRRHGHRLRVAAQLVESGNGYQSWSQTFERDWHQIFDIQTEIATAISSKMRLRVTGGGGAAIPRSALYTQNLEAYSALLKGRFYWNKRTVAGFQSAMEAYRQAIALDPSYAPAWAGLADCYTMLGFLNASSPVEARKQAREAAERAIALDDGLAAAHVALGQQLAIYEYDWDAAIAALERALELDPNSADAHYGLSKLLASLGRIDEALPHIQRAQRLDPLSMIILASLGWELAVAGRYQESDIAFESARELDPQFIWTHVLQSWSFEGRGLLEEAVHALRRAAELTPDSTVVQGELAHALGKSGRVDEARTLLDGLLARAQTAYVSPFDLARAYEGLGERSKALDAMSEACDQRSPMLLFAGVDPVFDAFRGEPRFEQILRRMKLV
jgi:TolB-like protein/Tfp pilus assembly protein PilF